MTVIAYKDGWLAADTSSWHGDLNIATAEKIFRLKDGSLFAGCGWKPEILRIKDWVDDGAAAENKPTPPDEKEFSGLLIKPDRSVWNVTHRLAIYPVDRQDITALGPHTEFLYGAMFAGASAGAAIALAIMYAQYAGGEVRQLHVDRDVSREHG